MLAIFFLLHSYFARLHEADFSSLQRDSLACVVRDPKPKAAHRAHCSNPIQSHASTATQDSNGASVGAKQRRLLSFFVCVVCGCLHLFHSSSGILLWSALNGGTLVKQGQGTSGSGLRSCCCCTGVTVPVIAFKHVPISFVALDE